MSDEKLWWVSINATQRTYIVTAADAGAAATIGGDLWRADETRTQKQIDRGIYDVRVRAAKFAETRRQPVLSVRLRDDGRFEVV